MSDNEKDLKRLGRLMVEARDKHTDGPLRPAEGFDGYYQFILLDGFVMDDIGLEALPQTYYVPAAENEVDLFNGPVFCFVPLSYDKLLEQVRAQGGEIETADNGAITVRGESIQINFELQWMQLKTSSGKAISLHEFYILLAANYSKDDEERDFILRMAYGEPQKERLTSIKRIDLRKVDHALTKIDRNVWGNWEDVPNEQIALYFNEDGSGEVPFNLATRADKAAGIERLTMYSIDFSALEDVSISRYLTSHDRRVYEALSSLWRQVTEKGGQDVFSISDIATAMGHKSQIGRPQRDKIDESLDRIMAAIVTIDNYGEATAYNYDRFEYKGQLLPAERINAYQDGQLVKGVVHLFREPPLFSFARGRKQFTTHSVKVLQTPVSKTDKNLLIEDYLRDEIPWMKNSPKRSKKILLSSIFRAAKITAKKEQQRKRKDVIKILDHYVSVGFIAGYEDTGDGFIIIF